MKHFSIAALSIFLSVTMAACSGVSPQIPTETWQQAAQQSATISAVLPTSSITFVGAHSEADLSKLPFNVARRLAHLRGRWLTSELPIKIPRIHGRRPMIIVACNPTCPTSSPVPSGYYAVSAVTGSYEPYYTSTQLSAVNMTSTVGTTDPGYDMQVNYPDGTSSIAIWLDNGADIAIMHPNGTSDIVSVTHFSGGMGAQLVQRGVSTSAVMGRRTMKLPYWLCQAIVAGGGLTGGWASVVIGELLTDGADTALSPWVYRFGAAGGGVLTGWFFHATGAF